MNRLTLSLGASLITFVVGLLLAHFMSLIYVAEHHHQIDPHLKAEARMSTYGEVVGYEWDNGKVVRAKGYLAYTPGGIFIDGECAQPTRVEAGGVFSERPGWDASARKPIAAIFDTGPLNTEAVINGRFEGKIFFGCAGLNYGLRATDVEFILSQPGP